MIYTTILNVIIPFSMEFGLFIFLFCLFNVSLLEGYKILLLPLSIESHQIYFSRFGEELNKHGHHVTFLIGDKKSIIPEAWVIHLFIFFFYLFLFLSILIRNFFLFCLLSLLHCCSDIILR